MAVQKLQRCENTEFSKKWCSYWEHDPVRVRCGACGCGVYPKKHQFLTALAEFRCEKKEHLRTLCATLTVQC